MGYIYARAPLCILWEVTIYFWHGSLIICCIFLHCEQAVIPRVLREKEAMGRASSQCLVAGLLTAARTCRKLLQGTPSGRALGSDNET